MILSEADLKKIKRKMPVTSVVDIGKHERTFRKRLPLQDLKNKTLERFAITYLGYLDREITAGDKRYIRALIRLLQERL